MDCQTIIVPKPVGHGPQAGRLNFVTDSSCGPVPFTDSKYDAPFVSGKKNAQDLAISTQQKQRRKAGCA